MIHERPPAPQLRYPALVGWAHLHDYPRVTDTSVRKWVVAGLLPHEVRTYEGWGPPRLSEPIGLGHQLLRLCHYRYDEGIGRLTLVGGHLFLDGFDIPLDVVRRALSWGYANILQLVPPHLLRQARGKKLAAAQAIADSPFGVAGLSGLESLERALLLEELASKTPGKKPGNFTRRAIGRVTGLGPVLSQQVGMTFGRQAMKEQKRLMAATDAELVAARDFALANPETFAGIADYRPVRRRSVGRFVAFTALIGYSHALAQT